jgi:uncharacterized membrane protein YtjA (UPF0391 family)
LLWVSSGGRHAQIGAVFSGRVDRRRIVRLTGIAAAAAGIAKILFFIFLVVFLALLIAGLMVGSALF